MDDSTGMEIENVLQNADAADIFDGMSIARSNRMQWMLIERG